MVEDKLKLNARNKFTIYMENKKLRKTPERYAIFNKVMSFNSHFNVEILYQSMEKDAYHVSKATIYNTLELLTDCGIIRRHQFGRNESQYEKVTEPFNHHHLICTECGKIKEIKDAELLKYLNTRKYPSFTTSYYMLYIYGICNSCARKIKRSAKEAAKK